MAKNIPGKEFKAAIKALNDVLKADGKDTIKVVGIAKEVVLEEFTNKVLDFIDNDKAVDLPEETIDFYNNYIVDDDEDEDDLVEETPSTDKKVTKKAEKAAAAAAKKAEKAAAAAAKKAAKKAEKAAKKAYFIPGTSGRPKAVGEAMIEGGTQTEIVKRADDALVAEGGASNIPQTKRLFEHAVRYLFYAGHLDISDSGVYSVK